MGRAQWVRQKEPNMKKKLILIAVPSGLLAVTALLLSDATPVRTEQVLAYGSVLALLAIAALDYGFTFGSAPGGS